MIRRLITLPERIASDFHSLEERDPGAWFVGSDPPGKKAGSGGGTAHILEAAYRDSRFLDGFEKWLSQRASLVIHSGGESRRLPAYAPCGKSLLPMPVFRWSKGQHLDQKLLDFQAGFYERILHAAPGSYTTLIGSGDVMFISSDRFEQLPEADALVFGVWVDDEVASRHGVFFSRREHPDQLAMVRQKPSLEDLRALSRDYFYLMDSGIVLLNHAATMKLMMKSGWDREKEEFTGGGPCFYDLYSDMLTAFGTEAGRTDPELGDLHVQLVPIHEGEFYHFGSNSDLIESALRLQNRVTDQRLRFTREADHHPSIFQQNSRIGCMFSDANHHIWIENCYIPESWELHHHHILTGIPENDWKLEIPENTCLDLVPLGNGQYGIRLYGYGDTFSRSLEEGAVWMSRSLENWLNDRGLSPSEAGFIPHSHIQELPLFPVAETEELLPIIKDMLGKVEHGHLWRDAFRLSARDLSIKVDPLEIYRQRQELKGLSLPRLASNHHKSIFYFLDLERIAADYRKLGLDLPVELPAGEPVIKRINDYMFRARVSGNSVLSKRYEDQTFQVLRHEMIDTLRQQPVEPFRSVLDDQILWGRSPVRLDLAGGWTDTPPYCIIEGGKVVNLSVELNGQLPLQVFARPLQDPAIILRSIDLGQKMEIRTFEDLRQYDTLGGGFSIPMAALALAGFSPEFSALRFNDLETRLKQFGCGIELSMLAAVPKGSGLGTSSNLAATVLGTLGEFCGLGWDKHEIAYRTLIIEQMLTTGGGWQDQYGGIFHGVKLLETDAGIQQRAGIKWLPDQLFTDRDTRSMMLLYYTGVTRIARDILGEIVKSMFLNSSVHLEIFLEMKHHAVETFHSLLHNDYQGLAGRVAYSWQLNQRLDEGTNPPVIQEIVRRVDDLMLGYKLLGAGGGGYLLMFAKSPEAAVRARKVLESDRPNKRARFVDFTVSGTGFQVSRS